jgi:hypothetical protein
VAERAELFAPQRCNCSVSLKQSLTSPPCREELREVQSVGAFSSVTRTGSLAALLEGMKMKHQVQYGTDSGIVSKEAVKQIRTLITDLACTVQNLDAYIAAGEKRPHADDLVLTRVLDTRRHNLMDTIASLEDRLGSIEHLRAREYGRANSNLPHTPASQPHSAGSSI